MNINLYLFVLTSPEDRELAWKLAKRLSYVFFLNTVKSRLLIRSNALWLIEEPIT